MAKRKKRAQPNQRAAAQAANSKRRRRKRTGKKTLHYILLVVFVLAAGTVLSLTTFFKIEEVRVVGTDKYPQQDIVRASGILVGENLFRVPAGQIAENLEEQFPYIESAKVRRKLPPAIEIEITQAQPAAALMEDGQIVLITEEGKVLERGELLVPPQVPIVQGISAQGIQPGQFLDEQAEEALGMVQKLLAAADAVGFEGITNVDVTNPLNMLVVYENRMLLKLGTEADLDHKLIFIQETMQSLGETWQGRIDATDAKTKRQLVVKDITLEEALLLEKKESTQKLEDNPLSENPEDTSEEKQEQENEPNDNADVDF